MALQFNTIGFINFNKDYNKVLKSGAITVSFTASSKNKDGEFETQYFNAIVPKKLASNAKEFINSKQLAKISGVVTPASKGYVNFTILEIEQYKKPATKEVTDTELPF